MLFKYFLQATAPASDTTIIVGVENKIESFKSMNAEQIVSTVATDMMHFGWILLKAIIIYIVGRFIIKHLVKLLKKIFEKRKVEASLSTFVLSLVTAVLTLVLMIAIISELGISVTSFVALFGAAGLAVGMAMSGTLQNFAGGVMILLLRPFSVGDVIEAQGQSGTVRAINLFNTVITTADNKTIYIPNGPLSTGILNNYSREGTRRVEWVFGIGYGDDMNRTRKIITELLKADKRILTTKENLIAVQSLGDNSVNIIVCAWVNSSDYLNVYYDLNEAVYNKFTDVGINIPFPQMDVHLHSDQLDVNMLPAGTQSHKVNDIQPASQPKQDEGSL